VILDILAAPFEAAVPTFQAIAVSKKIFVTWDPGLSVTTNRPSSVTRFIPRTGLFQVGVRRCLKPLHDPPQILAAIIVPLRLECLLEIRETISAVQFHEHVRRQLPNIGTRVR
jgi:hypothetical protein